ncbi:LicD family protein [bacterium]|nr:LicD family protein [bacterium]
MSNFFENVLKVLEKTRIDYTLGAESLIGFSEKNLFKYTHNLRLYLFPTNLGKILILALRLLFKGIVIKPKFMQGHLFYKLRYKPSPFSKSPTFISVTPLKSVDKGYIAFLGGHDTFFSTRDLDKERLQFLALNETNVSVPHNYESFIKNYTRELLAGFYQKHEISFDSESEKKAVRFMHDSVAVMNEAGINFWIEGGTLLGALRDQKLIPWDHDLDFGMIYKSEAQMKTLIRRLKRHFHVSVRTFPKTEKIWQLGNYRVLKIFPRKNLLPRKALCLDLFVYYEGRLPDTDELVYKYVVWDRNAFHRKEFFDTTEDLTFYGATVPVPSNPEKFIEVKYGKDWRTPVKEWNVALDDGSIYQPE